jgi:hypothetical protein
VSEQAIQLEDGNYYKSDGKGGYVQVEAPAPAAEAAAPTPEQSLEQERVNLNVPAAMETPGYPLYRQATNTFVMGQGDRLRGFGDWIEGKLGIRPDVTLDDAVARQRLISDYLDRKYGGQTAAGTVVGVLAPQGLANKVFTGGVRAVEAAVPQAVSLAGRAARWAAPKVVGGAAAGGLVEGTNAAGRGNSAGEVAAKTAQGMMVGGIAAPVAGGIAEGLGAAGRWVSDRVAAPVAKSLSEAFGRTASEAGAKAAAAEESMALASGDWRKTLLLELNDLRGRLAAARDAGASNRVISALQRKVAQAEAEFEERFIAGVSARNAVAQENWINAQNAAAEAEQGLQNIPELTQQQLKPEGLKPLWNQFDPKPYIAPGIMGALFGTQVGDQVQEGYNSIASSMPEGAAPPQMSKAPSALWTGLGGALTGAALEGAISTGSAPGNVNAFGQWLQRAAGATASTGAGGYAAAQATTVPARLADYLTAKYGPNNQAKGDFLESQRNAAYRAAKAGKDN